MSNFSIKIRVSRNLGFLLKNEFKLVIFKYEETHNKIEENTQNRIK